jgi:hypothetical protein
MPEYRFNFVRRQSPKLKFEFITRNTRMSHNGVAVKSIGQAVRGVLISGIVFIMFVFSVNLVVRYAFEKLDLKGFSIELPGTAKPKYFIAKDNMYTVFSSGKIEFVDRNMDSESYPFITGIGVDERRAPQKKALQTALSIDKKYLKNISEVNLSNPENIILITIDGKRIYVGGELTNDKMEDYNITLGRINRPYSAVDLRFKDRVIIR